MWVVMSESTAERLGGVPEGDSTRLAADGLEALLERLAATGSSQDDRIRQAVAAAAKALRRGRDPLQAAERFYRG